MSRLAALEQLLSPVRQYEEPIHSIASPTRSTSVTMPARGTHAPALKAAAPDAQHEDAALAALKHELFIARAAERGYQRFKDVMEVALQQRSHSSMRILQAGAEERSEISRRQAHGNLDCMRQDRDRIMDRSAGQKPDARIRRTGSLPFAMGRNLAEARQILCAEPPHAQHQSLTPAAVGLRNKMGFPTLLLADTAGSLGLPVTAPGYVSNGVRHCQGSTAHNSWSTVSTLDPICPCEDVSHDSGRLLTDSAKGHSSWGEHREGYTYNLSPVGDTCGSGHSPSACASAYKVDASRHLAHVCTLCLATDWLPLEIEILRAELAEQLAVWRLADVEAQALQVLLTQAADCTNLTDMQNVVSTRRRNAALTRAEQFMRSELEEMAYTVASLVAEVAACRLNNHDRRSV